MPNLAVKDPKDRNVQWVFLGSPGVEKYTYANQLSNLLGVPHIATGDLVREEVASSDPPSQVVFESSDCCFFFCHICILLGLDCLRLFYGVAGEVGWVGRLR
ncbi:hypothetical protein EV1_014360 [Malus domestica]